MINVTLPDGSKRELPEGATPLDLATSISKSLAKASIIAEVDGQEWDLTRPLEGDATVSLITRKDDKALEVIRHDTAHILAQAVQELFPGTQVTIGPAIEEGFYYDFAREEPFTPEDFDAIEKRMAKIVDADLPFEREVWDRNEAIAKFKEMGETYKAELIQDLPEDETITIYRQGDWFDLCRGPHLPSTGKIGKAFKLMKVAGAYWRGDHRNAMLQRIYGTAWADDKQLKAHLHRLEEAEKRDHRRLGKQMELFHFQEEAQGQVFWHPNGWTLYRGVQDYMRRRLEAAGYVEIKTPQLMDRKFWEASGHWDKYRENMFISSIDQEEKVLAVKPMNCPCHVQVFNQGQKSYRDLPLRLAEFGSCHRYEPSGSLHGLMRVRGFVQDDAHIFCTVDQITEEVKAFCELLKSVYADFGFEEPRIKFSDRPEQRVGSDEVWDKAEASLKEAAEASGLDYEHNPGDGAFYGPKLDFVLKDAIGREWQTGTIQCDFNLPERLDATFVGDDSEKHRPVMLHRAILGSLERFLGVLIENYAGKLPFWLAPRQVVIATITSDADGYAQEVKAAMIKAGLRAETDLRNEKINYKVREHSVGKVPVIAVVGRKEAEEGTLALRFLGEDGKTQEILSLDTAIERLSADALAPDQKRG
ncbi:MAG: threonine--tRNA ligase [Alphaproteobacteria bacterium]|uniref:threonine--tRNA ligase n=1 Tax=Maricaulis alexandrii TaxID=2570354 RepID=UPI001109EF28|nr:threonine--tRNA ligase [Maricaulis alexandrii]MCR9266700.1 threonine--tRNA ligase [Alphaproteobacteria bacterium]